jgi:hypothetical protein
MRYSENKSNILSPTTEESIREKSKTQRSKFPGPVGKDIHNPLWFGA